MNDPEEASPDHALRERVEALEWYHTIELPGGVVTPGFFDHRPVLHRYGLPDRLDGVRALDIGTFDGYFAFEMERRGAQVVALDVPDTGALDFPAHLAATGRTRFQPRHQNFEVARTALGSRVERKFVSVYDVQGAGLGLFDIVFVGSVLIHLRDPVGALMGLRSVVSPGGTIHICEEVHRLLDWLGRNRPLAKFQAISPHLTWWIPNRACWDHMLRAAGFADVEHGDTFVVPFTSRRGGVRHGVLKAQNPHSGDV